MTKNEISDYLIELGNPEIAKHSQRFFKTAKGEYGHGDTFIGLRVPVIRHAVKIFSGSSLATTKALLKSDYHEIRLYSVLQLVAKFNQGNESEKKQIFDLYLANTKFVNNWDLVDSSAHYIVGSYLVDRDKSILYTLVHSSNMWERRIAMMSTFYFIKNQNFSDALKIAKILQPDNEDLIHKAVGWMLREIGNRDPKRERAFLAKHYQKMPRTMLRYAIEKFEETERKRYLRGEI